jgi:hypothetical protein
MMEYQELLASMKQTLGKMVNEPLIKPSKFGGDGRAINNYGPLLQGDSERIQRLY